MHFYCTSISATFLSAGAEEYKKGYKAEYIYRQSEEFIPF
jgi:hypothetical protein